MQFRIKEFEHIDIHGLEKLIIYLQNFERDLEPGILNRGDIIAKNYLEKLIKSVTEKTGKIYLATVGSDIAGFTAGYLEDSPEEVELIDKKYFYISDIAVLPEYQGKGIGKALLAKMEEYVKRMGYRHLQINVLSRNKNAHKMYEKAGFRDYENILVKEL